MTKKFAVMQSALGLSLMLGMTATLLAQSSTTGAMRVTVVDPSGALVPRAQVSVTNAAGFKRVVESDGEGVVEVGDMAAGSYSVSVDAVGFTPALEEVQVVSDKVAQESVKLGISVYQDVEVFADR